MVQDNKIVVAITPTKDRHKFLKRQMDAFVKPYRAYASEHKDAPALKWIIIDESSEPSQYFKFLEDEEIIYVHLPDRSERSTVQNEFYALCKDCLYSQDDLRERVEFLASNPLSNRFIVAHDPWIPSIGELRNIGIKIAQDLYSKIDPNAVVFAKDDDDFSCPSAVPVVYDLLQGAKFVKFGNMLVHDAISGEWYHYLYQNQNQETYVLEDGVEELMSRYVVWDDKGQTVENPYKHAGIYGLSFTYRLDAACKMGEDKRKSTGVFGAFEPLSRREDVAFLMDMVQMFGEDDVKVLDNPECWITRISHHNTTRTIHHGHADIGCIPSSVVQGVSVLCGNDIRGVASTHSLDRVGEIHTLSL